jgi:hypothetical protein
LQWDLEIGPPSFLRIDVATSSKDHCLETLFLCALYLSNQDFDADFMDDPGFWCVD